MDEIDPEPIDKMLAAVRCLLSILVISVPWYYGTADWTSQHVYLIAAIPICVLAFCGLIYQHLRQKKSVRDRSEKVLTAPPWPSVLIFLIAIWATLQSVPFYSVGGGEDGPNSVRIQRMYLGESVPSVEKEFGLAQAPLQNDFLPADQKNGMLAWSVEPLYTKAAIGMMALVSALVWLGRVYFSSERGLPWLLTVVTAVGVAVAMFGVASLLSWNSSNILGLKKGYSFGPFISRNTGGCFLNICLSAAIGLTVWAFENTKRQHVDHRYAPMRTTLFERIIGKIETSFGQLTTFQIACVIASAIIFSSVIATSSRGAAIGALVAVIAVFIISTGGGIGFGRVLIAVTFLVIGASFLFWFELDDRLRARFDKSIWDEDFELARRLVWGIASNATRFYFWTGSGLGTFQFSHLPFQPSATFYWFYHAESLYWEALVDLGWVGAFAILGILGTFVSILWPPSWRYKDDRPIKKLGAARIGALALLLSVGLHSFFDFSMIVPACFVPAALLLGASYGGTKWEDESERRNTRSLRSGLQQRISSRPVRNEPQVEVLPQEASSRVQANSDDKKARTSLREVNASGFTSRGNVARKLVMSALLLALMCYSLPSLDSLARSDRMRFMNMRQSQIPAEQRAVNISVLLAGIWGDSPDGFNHCSDAMRTLGYAVLNEFQQSRTAELEAKLGVATKNAEALATPTITHIGLSKIKDNQSEVDEFFITPSQKARWSKTQQLFQDAVLQSPLDWRISYGIYLLNYQLPEDQMASLADRLRRITMHRPGLQLQMAALEHSLGRKDNALNLLSSVLSGSRAMDIRVAKLLQEWYPDSEMPIDIFPAEAASLLRVSNVIGRKAFPNTHGKLLDRAKAAAEALTRLDPMRSVYLARIARENGDLKAALEHYKEASRRTSNANLKVDMITTAIQTGDLEFAAEEIGNLRYIDRNNKQLDALQQMLEKAKKN